MLSKETAFNINNNSVKCSSLPPITALKLKNVKKNEKNKVEQIRKLRLEERLGLGTWLR
jgi:hypothetical protein